MGDYCVRVRVTYGSYVYPYGLRKRRVRWDFVADFVVAVSLENRYFADNICFTAVVFVSAFVMPQKCRVDYSYAQKLQIVSDARATTISTAAKKHNVDRSCIRRWMKKEAKFSEVDQKRKHLILILNSNLISISSLTSAYCSAIFRQARTKAAAWRD